MKWRISEIYAEKIFHNEWNLLKSHPSWENLFLDFLQPGEKEIRDSYKSGAQAGFVTGLFPTIHSSQFSFSYIEYFAPNFEGALPSCIHIIALINKAAVIFYKKSHNTQLLRPSTFCGPSRWFAGFQHIKFSENLCPKLRCDSFVWIFLRQRVTLLCGFQIPCKLSTAGEHNVRYNLRAAIHKIDIPVKGSMFLDVKWIKAITVQRL